MSDKRRKDIRAMLIDLLSTERRLTRAELIRAGIPREAAASIARASADISDAEAIDLADEWATTITADDRMSASEIVAKIDRGIVGL